MPKMEIKVSFGSLEEAARNLDTLAGTLETRKAGVTFAESKGEGAEAMQRLAKSLEDFGGAFAKVSRETAKKLRYTAGEFKRTDESMKY